MWDEMIAATAGRQHNRVSRAQLEETGCTKDVIDHRLARGRLVITEGAAVYAVAPALDDPWGRWMGATLTAPETYLSHWSAARAMGFLDWERALVTVTRPGNGGPRRHGEVLAFRRPNLIGEVGVLRGL